MFFFLSCWTTLVESLLHVPPSQLRTASRQPRLFCYALVRTQPTDESLPGLALSLAKSCDGWALFGSENSTDPPVMSAYRPTRAGEAFFDRNDTFLSIWSSHISPMLSSRLAGSHADDSYDFFVKVDSDSFLRPAAFRHLFAPYDSRRPLVLSVGRCGEPGEARSGPDSGSCTDGFFTAVSREAARRILRLHRPEVCRLAAFGDHTGKSEWDSDDATLLSECFQNTGIRTMEPRDAAGRFLVPYPDYDGCECMENLHPLTGDHATTLRSGTEVCGCEGCCLSPMLALFHPLKRADDMATMHELFDDELSPDLVN